MKCPEIMMKYFTFISLKENSFVFIFVNFITEMIGLGRGLIIIRNRKVKAAVFMHDHIL